MIHPLAEALDDEIRRALAADNPIWTAGPHRPWIKPQVQRDATRAVVHISVRKIGGGLRRLLGTGGRRATAGS